MKAKKQPPQSVFSEAWQQMSADMAKFVPQKFRGRRRSWKLALGLGLLELLVLGALGKWLYRWLGD